MTPSPSLRVLGVVVSDPARTRGMSLHGQTLDARAVATVAGWCETVRVVGRDGLDPSLPLAELCEGADVVVVHDPLCPLITVAELAESAAAVRPGVAVCGIRPVTDTVKRVEDGVLRWTLDRDLLAVLASPVAFGRDLVQPLALRLSTAGHLGDLMGLAGALEQVGALCGVPVPSAGRRVSDAEDLAVLALATT